MKRNLSFILNGISIYTDVCLVRDEIPIFFTCIDDTGKYFLALCVDMDLPKYNIVKVTAMQLNNMLQGILSMREVFTLQENYWEVMPVDDRIENDLVHLKLIKDINLDELPDEDAYFELFNNELIEYAKKINLKIYEGDYKSWNMNICEISDNINETSEFDISTNFNIENSITVETYDKTEYEKNLVFKNIRLTEYTKEESCLVENKNYSIKNQDAIAKKILVDIVIENFSLNAA